MTHSLSLETKMDTQAREKRKRRTRAEMQALGPPKFACPHAGCNKTYMNHGSLYNHEVQIHRKRRIKLGTHYIPPPRKYSTRNTGQSSETGRVYVTEVKHKDLSLKVGDSVYLRPSSPGELPYIAKMLRFWKDTTRDEMMFQGRWYFRASDTCFKDDALDAKEKYKEKEIFVASSNVSPEDNSVDTIENVCTVLSKEEFDAKVVDPSVRTLIDIYFCRRGYDPYDKVFCTMEERRPKHRDTGEVGKSFDDEFTSSEEDEPEWLLKDEEDNEREEIVRKKKKKGKGKESKEEDEGSIVTSESEWESESGTKPVQRGKTSISEIYETAHNHLQTSVLPRRLPCRENERKEIKRFVFEGLQREGAASALYISGMPGTGKTATVRGILHKLRRLRSEKKLKPFSIIEVNGMRLSDPKRVYTTLYKGLTGKTASPVRAVELLAQRFRSDTTDSRPTVLVVDELDQLVTRQQTILYNLFDWPGYPHAHLIVIGIANTMDLPERLLPRIGSRLGLSRVKFDPYTRTQLETIVKHRISGLNVFSDDAIELCARRIANISGDARRALEICIRSIELAERESNGKSLVPVSMDHIEKTVNEMRVSGNVLAIKEASLHEKVFLCAVFRAIISSGLPETTLAEVITQHTYISRAIGVPPPGWPVLTSICSRLGSLRLLLAEGSQEDNMRRVRLCVERDDIKFAVSDHPVLMSQLDISL